MRLLMTILSALLDGTVDPATVSQLGAMGAGLGIGICVFGAGLGIGKIGSSAMDAIARQPESVGDIRSNMIVSAALVEGAAFFAIAICFVIVLMLK